MKQSWKELGFKDKSQYVTAMILIASGIVIAFLSFLLIHTISSGVLIYIAQAFVAGGAIFGVSIYFRNQLIEAHSETMQNIQRYIDDVIQRHREDSH